MGKENGGKNSSIKWYRKILKDLYKDGKATVMDLQAYAKELRTAVQSG